MRRQPQTGADCCRDLPVRRRLTLGGPLQAQPTLPDSALGRLPQEPSEAGSTIRSLRDGGRAHENVLTTTEVLSGLDFPARDTFLGAVLRQAHGADEARARLISQSSSISDYWRTDGLLT